MSTPLFLDTELVLDKEAAPVTRLSEVPENWHLEITKEVFRQLPFLSQYDVNVHLDTVDEQQGYAMGAADVRSKTLRPLPESGPSKTSGVRAARIPLIIKERELFPLDVFLTDDNALPLTEDRFQQHMLRTEAFDSLDTPARDPSLIPQLHPPYRSRYGFGGSYETKQGSAFRQRGDHRSRRVRDRWDDPVYRDLHGLDKEFMGDELQKTWDTAFQKAETDPSVRNEFDAASDALKSHPHVKAVEKRHGVRFKAFGGGSSEGSFKYDLHKKASLLETIQPTIPQDARDGLRDELEKDASLLEHLKANGGLRSLAPILMEKGASAEGRSEEILSRIRPTVLQLSRQHDGRYLLKMANPAAYDPAMQMLDPATAERLAGKDLVARTNDEGTVTMTTEPVNKQTLLTDKHEVIPDFGEWRCETIEGRSVMGWVFPTLLDFDMNALPLGLFTNGSEYAVQDNIAGSRVGQGTNFPYTAPKGLGTFVHDEGGRALATLPVDVRSTTQGPDGQTYFDCTDYLGNPILLTYAPGLRRIESTGVGYCMPETFRFMPLGGRCDLVPEPAMLKNAQLEKIGASRVEIRSDGQTWSFDGGDSDKVAHRFLDRDEATFLAVTLGLSPQDAKEKIAEADGAYAPVVFHATRGITTANEHFIEAAEKIAALEVPELKQDTLKIPALLDDPMAVDSVLSLGFINEENVMSFLESVPLLEEVLSKLAEMLIAGRMGLEQVPLVPTEQAIRALDKVLVGLKSLEGAEA